MTSRCLACRRLFTLFLAAFPIFVNAQPVDPDLVQELLNRRGQDQPQSSSPLDRARANGADQNRQIRSSDISSERQRLSEFLTNYSGFSPIEIDFQNRAGQREARESFLELIDQTPRDVPQSYDIRLSIEQERLLRQVGYDAIRAGDGSPAIITGRISDDYILGVGDELVISLLGSTNRTDFTRVDREGRVVVQGLPPIAAAGRPFADFRAELERRVSDALLGTEVFVSIGNLRQITVYLLGQVRNPGSYQITSMTDLIGALIKAGGIERTGSLRRIIVRDRDRTREIDLYRILFEGSDVDLSLRDGARITVPIIGPTVAIRGEVIRPGIYELGLSSARDTDLSHLLGFAGGGIRPQGYNIHVNRIDDAGRQQISSLDDQTAELKAGDLVTVQLKRNLTLGAVKVTGRVRVPGERSIDRAPTLTGLLNGGEALEDEAYLPFAILQRTDPNSLNRYFTPVNLAKILTGDDEISLQDRDHLIVLGRPEIDFLSSDAVRSVILSGQSRGEVLPQDQNECIALDVLSQRVRQAELERFSAVLRSIYVGSKSVDRKADSERLASAAGAEVTTEGELAELAAKDTIACPEIFDEMPELLPLVLEFSVAVSGAIRQPGLYPLINNTPLQSLIAAGGGLASTANRRLIEIQRVTGAESLALERRYVDLTEQSARDVQIEPSSSIRFNSKESQQEPGTVLLTGEFERPGVYAISRGETLLEVMERAGGLTEYAYPYGAVFTRVSVAEEQRQALRRTVRELNNALTLAAMKDDVDGDALEAARQVSANIARAEVVGRMVIEADPDVLRQQPQLDVTLEPGDSLHIPKRPSFVLTVGDVLNPSALRFEPGKSVEDYIDETGGMLKTADKGRIFVVRPNGEAEPVTMSLWSRSDIRIEPGTSIIVPKDVQPLAGIELVRDLSQIFGQLAISAASIAVIFDNR